MTVKKIHTVTGKAKYSQSPNIGVEEYIKSRRLTIKASKNSKKYNINGEEEEDEQETKE